MGTANRYRKFQLIGEPDRPRVRKRSTVRASHALARHTSIQHVEELIAKQLNETDSNHTVTRIGKQVDGGTFVDGIHLESLPATSLSEHQHGANAILNGSEDQIVPGPTVDRIVIGVVIEDVVKGKVLVVDEHVPHVRVHACIVYHDPFRQTRDHVDYTFLIPLWEKGTTQSRGSVRCFQRSYCSLLCHVVNRDDLEDTL